MDKSRKVNVGSQQETMEKELMSVLTDMRKENYHINRTIIFMNVLKICPNFKGVKHSHNFMSQMKNWFYYGFNKRHNLSYKQISGASINLPPNWEESSHQIVTRVANYQVPAVKDGVLIPAIEDDQLINTYHEPMYRDLPGNYSWGPINDGNTQIATSGAEKEHFTVQLLCLKSGRKLRPIIIFKDAYAHEVLLLCTTCCYLCISIINWTP